MRPGGTNPGCETVSLLPVRMGQRNLKLTVVFISPDKFYKRRSQEKTHLRRLEFFLLRSPLDGARSVLTCRAICSVAGQGAPAVWVFTTSGFHRVWATKPSSSETNQAE